jgi:hypothetical protein
MMGFIAGFGVGLAVACIGILLALAETAIDRMDDGVDPEIVDMLRERRVSAEMRARMAVHH